MLAAICNHLEAKDLKDEINNALISIETTSIKHFRKLLRQGTETEFSNVILTPKWLIYAVKTAKNQLSVISGRLTHLRIESYEKSSMHKVIPDTGLNVFGFFIDEGSGMIFIGLGPEEAAQRFRDQLNKAVN